MAKTLIYRMWPLAWNGLKEMTQHLVRIKQLNVDYVWLGPLCKLPTLSDDDGVDGYKTIDKRFGTMQDLDDFINTAHEFGINVLMELSIDPIYPYTTYDGRKWFSNGGRINHWLVRKFKKIAKFWLHEHQVDGFSLRLSQEIDKNLVNDHTKFPDSITNDQAVAVINAIFNGTFSPQTVHGAQPFLLVECFDLTYDSIIDYYYCYAMVDFVLNSAVRNSIENGLDDFREKLSLSTKNENFMLELETPDTERFTKRSKLTPTAVAETIFESEVRGICIYQGQEIGADNKTRSHLDLSKYDAPNSPYGLYKLVTRAWKQRR